MLIFFVLFNQNFELRYSIIYKLVQFLYYLINIPVDSFHYLMHFLIIHKFKKKFLWFIRNNVLKILISKTISSSNCFLSLQNIDSLEMLTGIPEEKVVAAHGSHNTSTCRRCHKKYDLDWITSTFDLEIFHKLILNLNRSLNFKTHVYYQFCR